MNNGSTGRKGRTLGYKRHLLVGTWNLRSGIENQENYEMARQTLRERKLDLLCIPEAAKADQGSERGPEGEALYWVGPKPTERRQNTGVALMCSPYAARCIVSHTYVSDRILVVSFALLNHLTLDVIAFYAPHSSRPASVRKTFRDQLSSVRKSINRHHFVLELGDANALVGSASPNTPDFRGALGTQGIGNQNAAGRAFLDECAAAGMCIANTFFPHKDIHKYSYRGFNTHVAPGGDPEPVLYNNDFILVRRSFLRSVHDVKVYRGVNGVSSFTRSDHHLVVAKLKLKLRAQRRQAPKRDHSALASDPIVRARYQELVSSKIATMACVTDDNIGNATYQQFSNILLEIAENILPVRESRLLRQPPPSPALLELVAKKKRILQALPPVLGFDQRRVALKALSKATKKEAARCRAIERQQTGADLEDAAKHHDSGKAYRLLDVLAPKGGSNWRRTCSSSVALKDDEGGLLTSVEAQLQHLSSFYNTLLNEGTGTDPQACLTLPSTADPIPDYPLTLEEAVAAFKKLKNRKAVAPNGVSNEMLKYAPPEAHLLLFRIISKFWTSSLPAPSKVTDLISLPKKGDVAFAKNRRGIQVSCKLYQLKSLILARRMLRFNEDLILDAQAGFRLGRSCTDQRFTLQCILDQCKERSLTIYSTLIDLEKAFDRVDRTIMADIMRSYGYDETYINIAIDLHTGTSARVKWRRQLSEPISTSWGVQQGSPASNPLWNLFMDVIARQTLAELGPGVGIELFYKRDSKNMRGFPSAPADADRTHLVNLLLADDVIAFALTPQHLTEYLNKFEAICRRWGMTVSTAKTKIIIFRGDAAAPSLQNSLVGGSPNLAAPSLPEISVGGSQLEVVSAQKYLGSWYSEDCTVDKELTARIGLATSAAHRLLNIWNNKAIGLKTKLNFFKSLVLTILLHGAESWPLTGKDVQRLEVFQQRWLRKILKIFWNEHISNEVVLQRAGLPSIEIRTRQLRMVWLGHVIRLGPDRLPYQALFGQLAGQRSRGKGNIQTLGKLYHKDLLALQGGITNGLPWLQCALDPLAWLAFVMGTAAPTSAAAPAGTPVSVAVVPSTPLPSSSPHILPRTSPRSQQRMGLALAEELLPGVPNVRHYTAPVGPYSGRPRGRPNLGLTRPYQPTGRSRGRPRGSGRRGRSVRSNGVLSPI